MDDAKQHDTEQEYEPPRAEDVSAEDAPSVTAAGTKSQTVGAG